MVDMAVQRDKIIINKEMIPYSFEIALDDTGIYTIEVNYNKMGDFFTLSLYKEETLLTGGQPIRYGCPLFVDISDVDTFPSVVITPIDEAGMVNDITYSNFNDTIFLCIEDGGDG